MNFICSIPSGRFTKLTMSSVIILESISGRNNASLSESYLEDIPLISVFCNFIINYFKIKR